MLRSTLQNPTGKSLEESRGSDYVFKNVQFQMLSANLKFAKDKKISLPLQYSGVHHCPPVKTDRTVTITHSLFINILSYLFKKEAAH